MDEQSLYIRHAGSEDLGFLQDLEHRAFSCNRLSARSWSRFISRGSAYIAVVDGEPAGAAVLLSRRHSRFRRLYSFAVHPSYVSRGIGRRFLDLLLEEARNGGASCVRLEVSGTNARARALYEHASFVVTGTLPGYYDDGSDALRMEYRFF
ncbi:MAG: GNAT family N-acetyltransferase [Prosthecochloris sp.]|nr:GNAT family N-acetyltransferase [Prosthecochloris sp.]